MWTSRWSYKWIGLCGFRNSNGSSRHAFNCWIDRFKWCFWPRSWTIALRFPWTCLLVQPCSLWPVILFIPNQSFIHLEILLPHKPVASQLRGMIWRREWDSNPCGPWRSTGLLAKSNVIALLFASRPAHYPLCHPGNIQLFLTFYALNLYPET